MLASLASMKGLLVNRVSDVHVAGWCIGHSVTAIAALTVCSTEPGITATYMGVNQHSSRGSAPSTQGPLAPQSRGLRAPIYKGWALVGPGVLYYK